MKRNIPYSKQSIDDSDIRSVIRVLRSDWLTQGPTINKFEESIATYVEAKYAAALSSGTGALHAACFAAGIGPGDEVIVPAMTFAASANCILYLGAKPVLVDVDYENGNIDIDQLRKKVSKKTKAIIAVDFAGHPADWKSIREIAKYYKLLTIDDAAHALGSVYLGRKIGSIADLTIFSFHPVKTITTGEGGIVVTNNRTFYESILRFRHHGVVKRPTKGSWFYQMIDLGFNYRMTDIQAALGISQLKKIEKFINKRRAIVKIYNKHFDKLSGIKTPREKKGVRAGWHLYPARFNMSGLGKNKKELFEFLKRHGLGVQVHYIPIHFHPYYQKHLGYKIGDFPVAEKFYQEEISLPLYPELTSSEINFVIKTVKSMLNS